MSRATLLEILVLAGLLLWLLGSYGGTLENSFYNGFFDGCIQTLHNFKVYISGAYTAADHEDSVMYCTRLLFSAQESGAYR